VHSDMDSSCRLAFSDSLQVGRVDLVSRTEFTFLSTPSTGEDWRLTDDPKLLAVVGLASLIPCDDLCVVGEFRVPRSGMKNFMPSY
jgi:hypothetical protein